MEIVYCGGCGKVLREDDFSRGQAQFLDNRPWCAECRPPDKNPIPGVVPAPSGRKSGSSAKHPRVAAPMAPPPPADDSRKVMLIGAGVAVAAAIALAAFMSSGSPPAPAPSAPRRVSEPTPVFPTADDSERLIRELESFSSLAAPDKVLARCDELRSKLRGTPQEKRFQAVEAAAKTRELEVQLGRDLETIQRIIDDDARFEKFDEVVRRFKAAKAIAGPRAAEIDRRLAAYEALRKSTSLEKRLGPFAADDQGFIRHWLILGVFPNEKDAGIDVDFLKGEATHDPVAGLEVGKVKWGPHESADSKVDFLKVAQFKDGRSKDNTVAYAACLVQVPVQVAAEFRLGSDDGGALWVDGRPIGKVHRARSFKADEDRYAVPLAPGVHRVLVKVENHSKSFEFALRVVGPDGNRVPSLRVWN